MKTSKKYIAFLSSVAMIMAILLYFPSGIFSNIDCELSASAADYDTNGFGSDDSYQPATETNDKYDLDGDGNKDTVYEIGNAGQLYWFAQQVNNGSTSLNAVLTANITVNSNLFENLNDDGTVKASCTVEKWTPIGIDTNSYYGKFDGQGHTVSGLYFNDTNEPTGKYVGLFGYLESSGSISNVGVIDSYFNGSYYIGGICGHNNMGTITNCYNTGIVSGNGNVGGICGHNNIGTITKCYYLADSETDYINGTTHKTSTEFSDGTVCEALKYHSHQNGICVLCRNVENDIMIYGQSVTLDGTIGMNIYVAANKNYTNWTASFNGTNVEKPANAENGLYKFTYQVAAKDMAEEIIFSISNGESVISSVTVSVKEYADYILNKSNNYDETTKNMVSAMLNYCNAANKYFSKKTVPTADSVTSDNFKDYKFTLDTTPDGISYYGSSLLLESETTVRHYFKLAEGKKISDFTFTVNGITDEPTAKQGYYYIDVKNISADKLGTPHTVKIGDTAVISNYSALSYAKNVLESETADDNLKNLVKSLYLYNQKALAYNSATQSEGN